MTTFAPPRTNRSAVARPKPEAPPVTRETKPYKCNFITQQYKLKKLLLKCLHEANITLKNEKTHLAVIVLITYVMALVIIA